MKEVGFVMMTYDQASPLAIAKFKILVRIFLL